MTEPWKNLANGRGTHLAVFENFAAAAELTRMTVWSDGKPFAVIESKTQTPGRPRFIKNNILWGDYILNLSTGSYDQVSGIPAALIEGTGLPAVPSPLGGYVPAAFAWSTTGDYLVVSANWVGSQGPMLERVVLVDKTGRFIAVLSEKNEAAPTAVWTGKNDIVVGGRNAEIFGFDGSLIGGFNLTTPAVRIESSLDEEKLLIVEHGRLTVMDFKTQSTIGSKRGSFLDASIDTQGQFIMALDLTGQIDVVSIDEHMLTKRTLSHPDIIRGLSLGPDQVIASFSFGNTIRTALLKTLCCK